MADIKGIDAQIGERLDELSLKIDRIASGVAPFKSMRKDLAEIRQMLVAPRAVPIDNGLILTKLAFDDVLLAVEQEDRLIGPHIIMNGFYEKYLTAFMRNAASNISTFVDVGANIGYYTCLVGKKIRNYGQVFSFEPDPKNFSILKRNTEINWIDKENIRIECMALSDAPGSMTLYRNVEKPGNTSLIQPDERGHGGKSLPIEEIEVPVSTLDQYLSHVTEPVDLLKIDVEGYEFPILKGAINTLRRSPGVHLVVEWDPARWSLIGVAAEEVRSFLAELALRPHEIARDGSLTEVSQHDVAQIAYANLVWKRGT